MSRDGGKAIVEVFRSLDRREQEEELVAALAGQNIGWAKAVINPYSGECCRPAFYGTFFKALRTLATAGRLSLSSWSPRHRRRSWRYTSPREWAQQRPPGIGLCWFALRSWHWR